MFLWTLVCHVTGCFLVVNVLSILFGQHGLCHVNHWSQSWFQHMDLSPHSYKELGVTDNQVLGDTYSSLGDWMLPEFLNFLTWVFFFLLPWLSLLTPPSAKEIFISLPLYSNRYIQKLRKNIQNPLNRLKILPQDVFMVAPKPLFSHICPSACRPQHFVGLRRREALRPSLAYANPSFWWVLTLLLHLPKCCSCFQNELRCCPSCSHWCKPSGKISWLFSPHLIELLHSA